jgi:hypothetical protein
MGTAKSLDEFEVIAAMLRDAHASHGVVFNNRSLTLTLKKVSNRLSKEGIGFLTKTMYNLGKHFDQVLAGECEFNPSKHGFKTMPNSKIPRFLGELIECVLSKDGTLLPNPDAKCVCTIRQLLASFGKYKLPYSDHQEQKVISAFTKAEDDLRMLNDRFHKLQGRFGLKTHASSDQLNETIIETYVFDRRYEYPSRMFGSLRIDSDEGDACVVKHVREARIALARVFSGFDFRNIRPRHGPGVVATKQKRSEKFRWTNVSARITSVYPFDEYFCSSIGHVCDTYQSYEKIDNLDIPAQVILVPKDSRGPRLISCEPVDNQWIQQGIMRGLVPHLEQHPLTKGHVCFTDQEVNRKLALSASSSGDYVTIDLKEASDRVHIELVRLLYPENVFTFFECCRSRSTVLPSGEVIPLMKFAPMGSALCFPVMALTIWALLYAGAPDADIRENIYVYGDDVIVPTAYAESAMTILEYFGLKINRTKSCTRGLFRESCGMDAFNGICVTPVRFRTPWSELPSPSTYVSWIEYANSFYHKNWYATYEVIARGLESIYGPIPGKDMLLSCPSLASTSHQKKSFRSRWNPNLQKVEFLVRDLKSPSIQENYSGWSKLLRYFTESSSSSSIFSFDEHLKKYHFHDNSFDAGQYTLTRSIKLKRVWR